MAGGIDKAGADMAKLQRTPQALAAWQNSRLNLRHRRFALAWAGYQSLVRSFPSIPQLWHEFGIAAAGELEFAEAAQAFQRAVALAPNDPNLLAAIGTQYAQLRLPDRAEDCLRRAAAASPSAGPFNMYFVTWLERARKFDDATTVLEQWLGRQPADGTARYFNAFLLYRTNFLTEAENILRDLLTDSAQPPDIHSNAGHLLASILDGAGQYDEALDCLQKAKALRRPTVHATALEQAYDTMDQRRRTLLAQLTPDHWRRWREQWPEPTPQPLALLGGAPRSGTTLMEQILGANPDVLVFDETMALVEEILNPLHPPPFELGLTLEALDAVSHGDGIKMRNRYFKSLLRGPDMNPTGKTLIDKNPSATNALHIWLRLFPLSKVVIALRDPRDVVVSCYFQNIAINGATVNYLSLERAARAYGDGMEVWLRLRELGGFAWMETRYESIVDNLEQEGRRVTGFLGLPWDAQQASYYEAAGRKLISAPTYSDVTKPVYRSAVGRWRNYGRALEAVQPALSKYCRIFGYG